MGGAGADMFSGQIWGEEICFGFSHLGREQQREGRSLNFGRSSTLPDLNGSRRTPAGGVSRCRRVVDPITIVEVEATVERGGKTLVDYGRLPLVTVTL